MIIPIDFVAGTHGHFLEIVLNKFFNTTSVDFDPFDDLGASHNITKEYLDTRIFVAQHWFERSIKELPYFDQAISIQFDQDDLLLVSSVSFLRAGNTGIENNLLEIDTVSKLNNKFYSNLLTEIITAYPGTCDVNGSIPRNVLREFFKFGFFDPCINGYWKKQQQMHYTIPVFVFKFKAFYNKDLFVKSLLELQQFLKMPLKLNDEFEKLHQKFLAQIPYVGNQAQCNDIVSAVQSNQDQIIPALTLLQESYINAKMENIYKKEMPFHDLNYFTSTKDMLQYIKTQAPNL
jgi:hypothetical protein